MDRESSGSSAAEESPCCAAGKASEEPASTSVDYRTDFEARRDPSTDRMVKVGGEEFLMGSESDEVIPGDGEGPVRSVYVDEFYLDRHAVTNAEFAAFVKATGYTTTAEEYGWSFVFRDFVQDPEHVIRSVESAPWWMAVRGANWFHAEGPGSSIEDRLDHPVVHVSWKDAAAYCEWTGKRLPTEAEWEFAARGGLQQATFPWGDELTPDGDHQCNIWQGDFPAHNTGDDGYLGTAPVDEYEPNGYGLYNTSGNVWEWCSDWFTSMHDVEGCRTTPTGPTNGSGKVIRGGSYLCHRSYCNRYRVSARTENTPESTTGHTGFRCALDA